MCNINELQLLGQILKKFCALVFPCIDDEDYANEVYKALEKFKAKYNQIAIYFGLAPDKVEEIRDNYPRDSAKALNEVIVSWVRQEHNVAKFGYPCWKKVVEAAIGAENKLQAKKIAKSHPGEFELMIIFTSIMNSLY